VKTSEECRYRDHLEEDLYGKVRCAAAVHHQVRSYAQLFVKPGQTTQLGHAPAPVRGPGSTEKATYVLLDSTVLQGQVLVPVLPVRIGTSARTSEINANRRNQTKRTNDVCHREISRPYLEKVKTTEDPLTKQETFVINVFRGHSFTKLTQVVADDIAGFQETKRVRCTVLGIVIL
jgi:hypothetical protein